MNIETGEIRPMVEVHVSAETKQVVALQEQNARMKVNAIRRICTECGEDMGGPDHETCWHCLYVKEQSRASAAEEIVKDLAVTCWGCKDLAPTVAGLNSMIERLYPVIERAKNYVKPERAYFDKPERAYFDAEKGETK